MLESDPKPDSVDNWECVLKTNKVFEAEMLKNFLSDHEIPCHILSKKDSAYVVDHSSLSILYVYVPAEYANQALELIEALNAEEENSTDDTTE